MKLLREYEIPASAAVKFGDLTGDGQIDFLVLTRGYSAHAFDHDGRELWSWEAPAEGERLRAEFEAPGVLWDLDQDGVPDVVVGAFTEDPGDSPLNAGRAYMFLSSSLQGSDR